jgi:transaldolase/transaldolase/glucose-6-phosphate isomerase
METDMNPLKELHEHGQSFWLDFFDRPLVTKGGLKKLIEEDGLSGLTSNPTIFEKAFAGGDYDQDIRDYLSKNPKAEPKAVFEALAVKDIRMALDALRPIYDQSHGMDGFASLEVSPHLARDTKGTIEEARRLWKEVARPNLMIKVPATPEGPGAIEALTAEGVNVNVTLIFSLAHYEASANAYIRGLAKNADPKRVVSVASFFVSRVDTKVDKALEAIGTEEALSLRGKAAIANAKRGYALYQKILAGPAFQAQAKRGARPQHLLWGSTSTKNPAYRDVLYIEELIGPDTVNTIPPATVNAFRDHGRVRTTLTEGLAEAEKTLRRLAELGVDLDKVTEELLAEGVDAFAVSYDQMLEALRKKVQSPDLVPSNRQGR